MSQTIAPVLGEATIQELREAVRGEIVTPSDDGYAEACRIWNGAHDGRRPAARRALQRRRRRDRGGRLRAQQRPDRSPSAAAATASPASRAATTGS